MRRIRFWTAVLVLGLASTLAAKEDEALKEALEDHLVHADWIYDDVDKGFAEAKKTGKPLLVSFRCVP